MGQTITIKDVELFQTGVHNKDPYSLADLQGMISAAAEVGFTPPVKIGHMSDGDTAALLKAEGMPAFGWIKNLRMRGEKLVGDLCEVPRRIADLIRNGAYRRLSAEIYWNFAQNGKTWPRVLKAVSLLGAEVPAVTSLKEVEALYGAKPYASTLPPGEVKTYMGEIMPVAATGMMQKERESAGYRQGAANERCGACKFYLGLSVPGAVGSCCLVMGEIAADAVCDLYEVRPAFDFEGDGEYTVQEREGKFAVMHGTTQVSEHASADAAEAAIVDLTAQSAQQYKAEDGWVAYQVDREAVAKACPTCAENMVKRNLKALKYYYNTRTKEYAYNEGLCKLFGEYEGFRTRCMKSPTGEKTDDPGAFCNGLKTWCIDNGHLEKPEGGEKKHAADPEFESKHPRGQGGRFGDKPGGPDDKKKDDDWASGRPPRYPAGHPQQGQFKPPDETGAGGGGKKETPAGPRPLSAIARDIAKSWKNVNFGAKPYLDAMHSLESIDDNFMMDSGYSVVAYFLSNANGWKGDDAKRLKAELKDHMKNAKRKSFALQDAEGGEIIVEKHDYMIEKRGEKWCVLTKDGNKTLGCHDSEEKAKAQLGAVEASKARAAKAHAAAEAVYAADLDAQSEPIHGGKVLIALGEHQLVQDGDQTWHLMTLDRQTVVGTYASEAEAQVALAGAEPTALESALTMTPEQRLAQAAAEARVRKIWSPPATPNNTVVALGNHHVLRDGERWFVARVDSVEAVGEYADEQAAFIALAAVEQDELGVRMVGQGLSSDTVQGDSDISSAALPNANAEPARDAGAAHVPVAGERTFAMAMSEQEIKKLQEDLAAARVRIVQLEQEMQKAYQKVEANARATEENSQMHSKIAELQARVVEMETRDLDRDDKIILDNLVAAGKLLPAEREIQEKLLVGARNQVQSYSENGVRRERPMRIALLEALEKRPTVVQFGEVVRGDGSGDGLDNQDAAVELSNRITKFRNENVAATYEQAYKAVLAANPKLKQRYAQRSIQ